MSNGRCETVHRPQPQPAILRVANPVSASGSKPIVCCAPSVCWPPFAKSLDKRFRSDAVIGRSVLMEIALDKEHPQQRLKAATALLDRGGFHSMSEQRISVEHHNLTGDAMIERIKALALELGMDATKLIGSNAATPPALEVDYSVAEPTEPVP